MPFVQVNDVKLHYEMEGSGPLLLMVAGTGLPGATWRTGPSAQYAAEARVPWWTLPEKTPRADRQAWR